MNWHVSAPDYRVSPYRFTNRPVEVRRFLEAVGLRVTLTKNDFAVLRGAAGAVVVHPLAGADTVERETTSFSLEADDARAAAAALTRDGAGARWWDESFGRRAAVTGPETEISIREPMSDAYGYTVETAGPPSDGHAVDVISVFFTPDLDSWEAFFRRLGFTRDVLASGWRELRAGAESGIIGLHASETPPPTSGSSGLSFKTTEPLREFVNRMRGRGYPVTEEPEAQAPHVTVTDPDGQLIEIHQRKETL